MNRILFLLLAMAAGSISVSAQPIITAQPVGQTNWLGQSASFTVTATGSDPLSYQWQFNGTNLNYLTNSTLSLTNLQLTDQGFYRVVVSDDSGATNSDSVPLVVQGLAEALNATNLVWETFGDFPWTVDPVNSAVDGTAAAVGTVQLPGQQSVLQTTVNGPGTLGFWWQVTQPSVGFTYSLKANGIVLPLTSPGLNWQHQTCYLGSGTNLLQWVYTNAGPYTAYDLGSWLDEVSYVPGGTAPFFIEFPGNQTQPAGTNVVINAKADGTPPLNYRWFFNGVAIDGATNFAYGFELMSTNQAGGYSVIVTNDYGSVTSSVVSLTVTTAPPSLRTQPASLTLPTGDTAVFYAFAAGSPPISFQWYFKGSLIDGKTNGSLALPGVTTNDAGAYSVLVSSPYGSATSHVATLAVGWLPTITSQPTNQTAMAGSRAVLEAKVSGVGPFSFQWQLNGTNVPNNLITTVAGNGTAGLAGDGGMAATSEVNLPYAVTADGAGNVFIADTSNNCIRVVGTDGVITRVAGNGNFIFSGDGGPATNAGISEPRGIAVDGSGNMFIADFLENRVRRVDTNGIINRFAGNGAGGFGGDGAVATNASLHWPHSVAVDAFGDLFIADYANNRVRKVDTNGIITTLAGKSGSGFSGDGGAATNALLNGPRGVAVDGAGNVFIADSGNYRVREVDIYGTITTVCGSGSILYSGDGGMATNAGIIPYSMSVDDYGDLLVADYHNNRIRQIDPYGIITTIAGANGFGYNGDGIIATNAYLNKPIGVAVDSYGRILVADTSNHRIRRFGQGPALVLDNLGAADAGNYTLVIKSSFGTVTSSVVSLTVLLPPAIVNPPANQTAGFGSNSTFTVTATGTAPLAYQWQMDGTNLPDQTGPSLSLTNVQSSDAGIFDVIITNDYGSVTSSVATLVIGTPPSIVSQPASQMVLAGTNVLLSVAVSGDRPFSYQWQFNGTNLAPIITTVAGTNGGGYNGDGIVATNAKLNLPQSIAIDAAGNLFIADYSNNRVREVDTNGTITTIAGNGTQGNAGNGGLATNATLYHPAALAFDFAGNLHIGESGNGDVRKVDTNGIITRIAGTGTLGVSADGSQAAATAFEGIVGLAFDEIGSLYLCESAHCRVRKINTNGIVSTVAGNTTFLTGGFSGDGGFAINAQLNTPDAILVNPDGSLLIADTGNYRVRKVDNDGIITTIAGTGSSGYNGDYRAATNASLLPYGLALDGSGNLFISDQSRRIRKVDSSGIITTVAGRGSSGFSGDGGPATNAVFNQNWGIALDSFGNLFVADTGNNRVRKVHFTGDPTLALTGVGLTNAGFYTVVVTSPFGSVTSSNSTITVLSLPVILGPPIMGSDGSATLSLSTTPNVSTRIYAATNLTPPVVWAPIYTNPFGGSWQFADTNAASQAAKYYRASTP